ncbi:IMPACT family protein [Malikia spinosa]|jgi:uncharacterized YigZ family protein|uniref:IMPACT family protein n=1 Tax=Malikia spinosa TaxID=86180 RepID=UPI003FA2DCA0
MPYTLKAPVEHELLIKKSRFISCVQAVEGRQEALAIVQALRERHPGAAHVCWALLAGGQSAANDDGEPGGTAGRPMLEVLRHQELEGVLATVVRYYGGIKLGAGGLVRAYTDAVAQALAGAHKVAHERQQDWTCQLPYSLEGWVRRELELGRAQLLAATHGSVVTISLRVSIAQASTLRARLDEGSQGRLLWLDQPQQPAPT